jgi:hypothetical protein
MSDECAGLASSEARFAIRASTVGTRRLRAIAVHPGSRGRRGESERRPVCRRPRGSARRAPSEPRNLSRREAGSCVNCCVRGPRRVRTGCADAIGPSACGPCRTSPATPPKASTRRPRPRARVRDVRRLLFGAGTRATRAGWRNIRSILGSAGMTVDNIVRVTSYLRDRRGQRRRARRRPGRPRRPLTAIVAGPSPKPGSSRWRSSPPPDPGSASLNSSGAGRARAPEACARRHRVTCAPCGAVTVRPPAQQAYGCPNADRAVCRLARSAALIHASY